MDIKKLFPDKFKKAENYMNKTYGERFNDKFRIMDGELAGFTSAMDKFTLQSEKMPDCVIRLEYFQHEYDSNYIQLYYADQYQNYMQKIFEELLGECKVIYDVYFMPAAVYNEKTTFEEFLHDDQALKEFIVIIPEVDNLDEKTDRLLDKLKELKLPIGIIEFVVLKNYSDSKLLHNLNDWGEYDDKHHDQIVSIMYYKITREYTIKEKRKGRI